MPDWFIITLAKWAPQPSAAMHHLAEMLSNFVSWSLSSSDTRSVLEAGEEPQGPVESLSSPFTLIEATVQTPLVGLGFVTCWLLLYPPQPRQTN